MRALHPVLLLFSSEAGVQTDSIGNGKQLFVCMV